jgi:hypothetical protein
VGRLRLERLLGIEDRKAVTDRIAGTRAGVSPFTVPLRRDKEVSMPPVFCADGTVLVTGARFDLERVLDAYEQVVDALAGAFPGGSDVRTRHANRVSHTWPVPGRAYASGFWRKAAESYEVVEEPLLHRFGGALVKAYVLGKTWLVYVPEADRLFTPTRGDVSELDPSPTLCFYGPARADEPDVHALLDARTLSIIRGQFDGPLAALGLEYSEVPLARDGRTGETLGVAYAQFPHARYGDGIGPIRVRCVTSGGAFVAKNVVPD